MVNITIMKNITAKIKHFHPVCDEALHAILGEMTVMHCPKNTTIVHSGRIDRNVYFVEEGVVRSVFHKDGIDTTTWFSLEGDVTFGMHSLYYNTSSLESIETVTDCVIYKIPIDVLNAAFNNPVETNTIVPGSDAFYVLSVKSAQMPAVDAKKMEDLRKEMNTLSENMIMDDYNSFLIREYPVRINEKVYKRAFAK